MNNKVRPLSIYLYYTVLIILGVYVILSLGGVILGKIKGGEARPVSPQQTQKSSNPVGDASTQPNLPSSRQPSSASWPWLLALVMIVGQIWMASSDEVFQWPSMFRFLGTLAFAAFALMIAVMITNEKAITQLAIWEIFEILLTPFIGFVSCYLTANVLETFDKIKENTDRLREAD